MWWPRDALGVGKPSYRSSTVLDLTDATGRAHAAWWALGKCYIGGWPDLHTGARLWLDPCLYEHPAEFQCLRSQLWRVLLKGGRVHDWIGHLDFDDIRTLEDGSRWVDAEALRVLCQRIMEQKDL